MSILTTWWFRCTRTVRSISGKISVTGTISITITDNTILGSGAKVKVISTIVKTSVASKIKTTNLSKQVKVVFDRSDVYLDVEVQLIKKYL